MGAEVKPTLKDIGHQVLITQLPHLPDTVSGQNRKGNEHQNFEPHPEAETLSKIYNVRLASTHITDPSTGRDIELAVTTKNHPYILGSPYDLMVQYFGREPIRTPVEWRDEQFCIGQRYFGLVAETMGAMIDLVHGSEPVYYLASTNCAPFSKYGKPLNVQSVSAPHTHVIGITERDVRHMDFMTEFPSQMERRKYIGLNSYMNRLYRQLVAELLVEYAVDEHGRNFDEIGANRMTPLMLEEVTMSTSRNETRSLPPGFSFTLEGGLRDIASADFLNKIITFDEALRRIYEEIAAIFLVNYDKIPDIGNSPESSVPLVLRAPSKILIQRDAFVDKHNGHGRQQLSEQAVIRLNRVIRHLVGDANVDSQKLLGNLITRGHAYSLIMRPEDHNNPYGPWKVNIPLWIYGGGGVEGIGIEKERINEGRPQHQYLVEQYLQLNDERRAFQQALVTSLVNKDPQVYNCLG